MSVRAKAKAKDQEGHAKGRRKDAPHTDKHRNSAREFRRFHSRPWHHRFHKPHSGNMVETPATKRVLYLFSGKGREGSLGRWLRAHGIETDEIDIEAFKPIDLSGDSEWQNILDKVRSGYYSLVIASPPCGTFSAARKWDGGPTPLRGHLCKARYGFAHLGIGDKAKVKLRNWFAIMTAKVAQECHKLGTPWPLRRQGKPSLFELDELKDLKASTGASFHFFAQCKFGSEFQKNAELLATLELEKFNQICDCPSRWWTIPWSGELSAALGQIRR